MKDFAGKVAVITGGASGIGRAIAERCVHEGTKVVLADVEESALATAANELRALGGTVLAVRTDVSKREDVESLANAAFEAFGAVHLLFNNAGVAAGGPAWDATWHDWEWVIGVNLWGVIHGVRAFVPRMLAQNTECHIVNTASAAGLIAGGMSAPYSVTKHAVVALSESLYLSLARQSSQIGASVLCPGMVQSNIATAARNRPEQLQDAAVAPTPQMQAGKAALEALIAGGMAASKVADKVFAAIQDQQFYILTHPEWMEIIRMRTDRLTRLQNPEDPLPAIMRIMQSRS